MSLRTDPSSQIKIDHGVERTNIPRADDEHYEDMYQICKHDQRLADELY